MNTKDIVLIGLLAAFLKSSQAILSFLPNIEIVSLLILIFAIRLGSKRTIYITVLFSTLNIMIWGLSPATLGYFFVWSGYAVVCNLLKNVLKKDISVAIFLGTFGFVFGGLFALIYLPMGYSYALSYWVNGFIFDLVHGVSNFVVGLWAFTPVLKGFDRAMNKVYKTPYGDNSRRREI